LPAGNVAGLKAGITGGGVTGAEPP